MDKVNISSKAILRDGCIIDPFPAGHKMSGLWYLFLNRVGTPTGFVEYDRFDTPERKWAARNFLDYHSAYGRTKEDAIIAILRRQLERAELNYTHAKSEAMAFIAEAEGGGNG